MKLLFAVVTLFCFSIAGVQAQTKLPALDKSPMDVSYYPNRYPVLKIQDKTTEPPICRVVYSRPQKSGRVVFGDLLEYGKVWRLGANEATEIEFFNDVKVKGTKIKKGRYTMYGIPNEDKWTLIINKDTDTWGSFKYDEKNDVIRIEIPVQKQTDIVEEFTMAFDKAENGASLIIAWDDVKLSLPIEF